MSFRLLSSLGAAVLSLVGCGKSFDAMANLDPAESDALGRLLVDSGLDPKEVPMDAISIVGGHLNRIVLDSPPKRPTLKTLEAFGGLESLELIRAADSLESLPEGCGLTELRLAFNGISDLSPLARCESLERLWIVDEPLASLATLPPLPKLTALYVDRVELDSLEGVGGRPKLKTLLVTNAGLSSLEGLEELPGLKTLDLSDNALTDASSLDEIHGLTDVDVANNALSSFPAVVLRADIPKISGNPGANAEHERRTAEAFEAESARRRAERKLDLDVVVPPVRGSARGASKRTSWSGSEVEGEGRIDELTGVFSVKLREFEPTDIRSLAAKRPAERRMEFTVAQGRVRVFFGHGPGAVPSMLVEPGTPRVVRTNLAAGDRWVGFIVHAEDGTATGLRYTLGE